tara:strand:- start:2455 stop:2814 length:360 start_codon:yes stop_codon:yes gene_type:complete
MIDTDKYEGHTGPWFLIDGDIYKGDSTEATGRGRSANMIADTAYGGYESIKARKADSLLMADAPLILAKLKDLRDRIERATKILCFDIQPENGPDYYLDLAHERSLQMSAAIDVLEGKE